MRIRQQWANHHQSLHTIIIVYYDEPHQISRVKVEGKGQGHGSIENHNLRHNFVTKCRRDFRLVPKCSEYNWLQTFVFNSRGSD